MRTLVPIVIASAMLINSNVAENDYPEYIPGGNYMVGQYVIVKGDVHKIYQCLAMGTYSYTDATKWLDCGMVNRWLWSDKSVASQTTNPVSIENEYRIPSRCNTVALLNVSAANVRVQMIDDTDGVVYDKSFSMGSTMGINNYYAYCFEPISRKSDLILMDLPNYANARIIVTINEPTGIAKVGVILIGRIKKHGDSQYGIKLGIDDFSIKESDEMGAFRVVERDFRKTNEVSAEINSRDVDAFYNYLISIRAKPTLFIGSTLYTSTYAWGFYKDFSIVIPSATKSLCNISIESLI